MKSSRRLMAIGFEQLPQKHNFGRINCVSLKDQEMHLTAKKHQAALALINATDKAPTFAGFDVDRGLKHGGVNRPTKQPRFEHLDTILFHNLTITSQQPRSKP